MGLLDDAIREHLELKRRRGADAGDISRQESDALGPVRRLPGRQGRPARHIRSRAARGGGLGALHSMGGRADVGPCAARARARAGRTSRRPSTSRPPRFGPRTSRRPRATSRRSGRARRPPPAHIYEPPSAPSYEPPSYQPPPAPSYPPAAEPSAEPESDGWMETPLGSPSDAKSWMDPRTAAAAAAHRRRSRTRIPTPGCARSPRSRPTRRRSPRSRSRSSRRPRERARARARLPDLALPDRPPGQGRGAQARGARRAAARSRVPDDPRPGSPAATRTPPTAAADAPADDVLEETPDFLEETPEHDRLWFEQRPPRDFDFDG